MEVAATYGEESWSSVSDESGRAVFPELFLPPPSASEFVEDLDPIVLTVFSPAFVPMRREVTLNSIHPSTVLQLLPKKRGYVSPLIDAVEGGRFQLPGIGFVQVDPGVLHQDACLRILPVPSESSSPNAISGDLTMQYWVDAVDAGGAEVAALPNSLGGITLRVALPELPKAYNGTEREWSHYSFDAAWALMETSVPTVDESAGVISFDVAGGSNLVAFEYRTVSSVPACEYGPWELLLDPRSTTTPLNWGVSVSVYCGVYANEVSVKIGAGETKPTTVQFGGEISGELGWTAGTLFTKASAKLGMKISGSVSNGTATTTMAEASKQTPPSGAVNGQDQTLLTPPWSCLTGTARYGLTRVTYSASARRTCTNPDGTIQSELIPLGSIDTPGELTILWDVEVDEDCGEGCEDASAPGDLPN